jgi:membrane associated rhomboid family serine protease
MVPGPYGRWPSPRSQNALLHGGVGHLALNGVMLTVMGQVLERRLGWARFLLLFASGAAGGALVHVMIGGAADIPSSALRLASARSTGWVWCCTGAAYRLGRTYGPW